MKRISLISVLIAALALPLWPQSPRDVVVILDASSSMSNSYDAVSAFVSGPFLRENLRIGDTFHFISFTDRARVELSRRIETRGDIETVIGRLLLWYPVNTGSDIFSALDYGLQYVSALPGSRSKQVALISDGDHSPDGKTSLSKAEFDSRMQSVQNSFRKINTEFTYIPIPLGPQPAPSRQQPRPVVQTPESPIGTIGSSSPAPQSAPVNRPVPERAVQPSSGAADAVQTPASVPEPKNLTEEAGLGEAAVSAAVSAAAEAAASEEANAESADSASALAADSAAATAADSASATAPATAADSATAAAAAPAADSAAAAVTATAAGSASSAGANAAVSAAVPFPLISGIFSFFLCFLIVPFAAYAIRLRNTPKRAICEAAGLTGGEAAEAAAKSPLMLSLYVEDQNAAIGRRNIHTVKPGSRLSIGGGNSDFLIFLVPVAPRIGELRLDSEGCTFIPKKPKYFPDLQRSPLQNCIGETIRVISNGGHELHIRIEKFRDPLQTLNDLLNSIYLPGVPEGA
jgi:hypothetical protein